MSNGCAGKDDTQLFHLHTQHCHTGGSSQSLFDIYSIRQVRVDCDKGFHFGKQKCSVRSSRPL